MKNVPPTVLRDLLEYTPSTGRLTWKRRDPSYFTKGRYSADRAAAAWNSKNAGKEAFTALDNHGYRQGRVFDRPVKAHRVIWSLVHGEWPSEIDHVNGDRSDNRLCNLRCVSHADNQRNQRIRKNSSSGVLGVSRASKSDRWRARIKVDFQEIFLGHFTTFDEAVAARREAERRFSFHENHGGLAKAVSP